ncbi:hypothetical protein [Aureivirga marina]|uniref:hypothetical protein n=1 Tax=Aureivirga marina TaxID=1182451 RepID=UPI0018CB5BB5|nr:hypothetical protein [Aureivirga marina]
MSIKILEKKYILNRKNFQRFKIITFIYFAIFLALAIEDFSIPSDIMMYLNYSAFFVAGSVVFMSVSKNSFYKNIGELQLNKSILNIRIYDKGKSEFHLRSIQKVNIVKDCCERYYLEFENEYLLLKLNEEKLKFTVGHFINHDIQVSLI